METKKCARCEHQLPLESFPWKGKEKKTRQSYCSPCFVEYRKEHYNKNKQYYKDKAKSYKKLYKEEISQKLLDYFLDHPCVDCGMEDPRTLEFDHVDTKGSGIHRMISGQAPWDKILEEIAKCEVRCSNCHRIVTINRAGFHRANWVDSINNDAG